MVLSQRRSDSVYVPTRSCLGGGCHGRFQIAGGPKMTPAKPLPANSKKGRSSRLTARRGMTASSHQLENDLPLIRTSEVYCKRVRGWDSGVLRHIGNMHLPG